MAREKLLGGSVSDPNPAPGARSGSVVTLTLGVAEPCGPFMFPKHRGNSGTVTSES